MEQHTYTKNVFKRFLLAHQKAKILKSRAHWAVVTVHDFFFISAAPHGLLLLYSRGLYNAHHKMCYLDLGSLGLVDLGNCHYDLEIHLAV